MFGACTNFGSWGDTMIAIILGTRSEIIKMSPIIRGCEARGFDYFILHSGQHYSYEMDRAFFEDLELPEPEYNLDVGSGGHGEQTARILTGIEDVLMKEEPDIVLVQGDTNTVMSGSLAAAKLHIRVGHVEAGLRSFDRAMPEEVDRVIEVGANVLVGTGAEKILTSTREMLSRPRTWENPYGDGMASRMIVTIRNGLSSRNNCH